MELTCVSHFLPLSLLPFLFPIPVSFFSSSLPSSSSPNALKAKAGPIHVHSGAVSPCKRKAKLERAYKEPKSVSNCQFNFIIILKNY